MKNIKTFSIVFSDEDKERCIIWLGVFSKFIITWTDKGHKEIHTHDAVLISETLYSKFELGLSGDAIDLWGVDLLTGRTIHLLKEFR